MKHKFLLILTAATLLASSSAKAWGGFGHTLIAYTAEQYLTPEAKAKCEQYLGHSVPYCASWMDYWRAVPPYTESTHWHVCRADENNNLIQDKDRCAALQIMRICKELKNYKKLPTEQVDISLKLLIHMVGDMHCTSFTRRRLRTTTSASRARSSSDTPSGTRRPQSSTPSWMSRNISTTSRWRPTSR